MLGDILLFKEKHYRAGGQIVEVIQKLDQPKLVAAIGGESGSGKSELSHVIARKLKDHLRLTKILHVDNYYKIRPQDRADWRRAKNFENVGLGEIDWELLERHLEIFKTGGRAAMPCIDLLTDQIDTLETDFKDIRVIIVDGLYPLNISADVKIMIDLTYHDTKKAQLLRGKESMDPERLKVLEMEHQTVQSLRGQADYFITPEFQLVSSR